MIFLLLLLLCFFGLFCVASPDSEKDWRRAIAVYVDARVVFLAQTRALFASWFTVASEQSVRRCCTCLSLCNSPRPALVARITAAAAHRSGTVRAVARARRAAPDRRNAVRGLERVGSARGRASQRVSLLVCCVRQQPHQRRDARAPPSVAAAAPSGRLLAPHERSNSCVAQV